jgi:hypothetical protein
VTYISVDKIMVVARSEISGRIFSNRFRRRVYPQKTCLITSAELNGKKLPSQFVLKTLLSVK